jgi:hypothetical protein
MMPATAGDYANLHDALRAATGRLSESPQLARTAAAEAVAQLWQSQDDVITGHQLAAICHAAHTPADGHSGADLSALSHGPLGAADSTNGLDVPDLIDDDHISRTRTSMMAALADAVAAHEQAAEHLAYLRGSLCDPDLSDSRDGHDLAAHIDTAIRCGRAAYAVLHAIKTT